MLHINQQSGSTSNLWQGLPDARAGLPDHLSGQATLPRLPPHHMLASTATSGGLFSNHLTSLAGTSTNGFNTLNTVHSIERGGGTPLSPASVLSNYSLNRNMVNHLNLTNLVPTANR